MQCATTTNWRTSHMQISKRYVFVGVWSMTELEFNSVFLRVCACDIVIPSIKKKMIFYAPVNFKNKSFLFLFFSQIQIQLSSCFTRCLPLVFSPPPCFTSQSCCLGTERLEGLVRCAIVSLLMIYILSFSVPPSLWLNLWFLLFYLLRIYSHTHKHINIMTKKGLILNNYASNDVLGQVARAATAMSIIASYPLVFTSLRDVSVSTVKPWVNRF
jgi:hypothetical protein